MKNYCNYFECFFVFTSVVSGFVSISDFASLVTGSVGITSSAVELKICAVTAAIKECKSIIKKKRKKHDKRMFLGNVKSDAMEVLISKALIHSYVSHDEFV